MDVVSCFLNSAQSIPFNSQSLRTSVVFQNLELFCKINFFEMDFKLATLKV